jgi:energy-coupling factor transport system ATP-binding protein
VRDDVAYGLRESGIAAPEVAARVAAALEEVGLPPAEFLQRAPFHLSGGEMRRVALAGALAQGRPLLLLDEPTLGLDAEGLGRLHGILARLHARGVACWTISHDADFVAATCERVVVLDRGQVVFDAAAAQFWEDPQRAEACGVEVPRALTLAARLRAHGIPVSGAIPSAHDIATALAAEFGAGL